MFSFRHFFLVIWSFYILNCPSEQLTPKSIFNRNKGSYDLKTKADTYLTEKDYPTSDTENGFYLDEPDDNKKSFYKSKALPIIKKFKFKSKKSPKQSDPSEYIEENSNPEEEQETVASESDAKKKGFPFQKFKNFKPLSGLKKKIKKFKSSLNTPSVETEPTSKQKFENFFKGKFKKVKGKLKKLKPSFKSEKKFSLKKKFEPVTKTILEKYQKTKENVKQFTPFDKLLNKFRMAIAHPSSTEELKEETDVIEETLLKEDEFKNELINTLENMSYSYLKKLLPYKDWIFDDFITYKEKDVHGLNCRSNQMFLLAVAQLRSHIPDITSNALVDRLCLNLY